MKSAIEKPAADSLSSKPASLKAPDIASASVPARVGLRPETYANITSVLWAEAGDDAVWEFVRRLVFSVLIGNADMHLKNWSLLYPDRRTPQLSPGYDFVATLPYIPSDTLALSFGGSRSLSEITSDQRKDWEELRLAVLANPAFLEKVQQVCRPRIADPYAQRYHFWMHYAEEHRGDNCKVANTAKLGLSAGMKTKSVVKIDPEIMGGTPCFAGTRVPARTLFDYLEGGDSLGSFLEDFPTVSRKQAVALLEEASELLVAHD